VPEKEVLKLALYLGIGDIVLSKAALDSIKNQYDEIYISPYIALLEQFRPENQKEYLQFIKEFFTLLFSEPPYIITDDQSYSPFCPIAPIVKPNLVKYLCTSTSIPDIPKPYFVLTTKVREYPYDVFEQDQLEIIRLLQKISLKYKPVILGERVVGMNAEYKSHGSNNIYSLYDTYKNNLDCLDFTFPEVGITSPSLESIKSDCTIMHGAKFTFSVGLGGNLLLALSVGKVIGWAGRNSKTDIMLQNGAQCIRLPDTIKELERILNE
jgi:hypothetical protein